MFNKEKNILLGLAVFTLLVSTTISYAADSDIISVDVDALPISTANSETKDTVSQAENEASSLVSPSKPEAMAQANDSAPLSASSEPAATENIEKAAPAPSEEKAQDTNSTIKTSEDKEVSPAEKTDSVASSAGESHPVAAKEAASTADEDASMPELPSKDDFNFDLKMKSISKPAAPVIDAPQEKAGSHPEKTILSEDDLPKAIQYKTNPMENLGNSILSQMDDDLFSQMSEIEKSTTLLTLELRREKIRNEIEAQKAIRQKAYDDLQREKAEAKLKELERKKQIEANVLKEKQNLIDKQQILEVLKQRKLLNAYMNHMLVTQQDWLKEKEGLYAKLAAAEQEKKELTELFKQKVDSLVEASAKNMQAAEAAKANFERVVKGLKARNDQLRKRIEADAKIIKNAQNSLYQKSQSLEELQNKTAAAAAAAEDAAKTAVAEKTKGEEEDSEVAPVKLSAQYAILGISGRGDSLSIDVIDALGMPVTLKKGDILPTGHILQEIGDNYAMFSLNGVNEYLHVGRTIDGIVPNLGLTTEK